MLSIVIPTKNEEHNIATCVGAFTELMSRGGCEVVVVDNSSDDRTVEIARSLGARVFAQGPERCAQRNRGWREASGEFVMFVDADMIVPPETIDEIVSIITKPDTPDALYVREIRVGKGWRIAARNFERSFYNGTLIDGLRVIRRSLLERIGGYDETLVACEDWDLDRRLLAEGVRTAITTNALLHNEAAVSFSRHLGKKRYYACTMDAYRQKWQNDAIVRKQFSLWYRFFGVFFERGGWRRVLCHPFLYSTVLLDRLLVGIIYLMRRH